MQNIIIDLQEMGRRVSLPSDQWKSMRQWLEEREIAYEEQEPGEADVGADDATVLVFEIKEHNEAVNRYLESHS